MKKLLCLFTVVVLLFTLTACNGTVEPVIQPLGIVNYTAADKLVKDEYFTDFDKFKTKGENKTYTVDGTYDISEGNVVITSPGTYKITGKTDTYCIKAAIPDNVVNKNITLLLDNVTVSSKGGSKGSAIYAERCDLTLVLCENTVNSLSEDTKSEHKGVITLKSGHLTIEGTGTLVINTAGTTNGIYTNGDMVINGGVYNINAKNHGIYSLGDMTVNAGEFNIKADRFGIKCGDSPDAAGDSGDKAILALNNCYVEIDSIDNGIDVHDELVINKCGIKLISKQDNGIKSDSKIEIIASLMDVTSGTDGIDSSGQLNIKGNNNIKIVSKGDGIVGQDVSIDNEGIIYITTMSDYIESTVGSYILKDGIYIKVNPLDYPGEIFYDHTVSCKGIKAANTVEIFVKVLVIDSMEDGIHALNVNVYGGEYYIITEEDGIQAENKAVIDGPATINVHKSYKGIKALDTSIKNGYISVASFSDAIDSFAVNIENSKVYLLDKVDTGVSGTFTVKNSDVIIVTNSSNPTLPTNKDIGVVKAVISKPQVATSEKYITLKGDNTDITLKLSKSFADKMSVTYISSAMKQGNYTASIGSYEGEFNEIYKSGIELSDTYVQKLTRN